LQWIPPHILIWFWPTLIMKKSV